MASNLTDEADPPPADLPAHHHHHLLLDALQQGDGLDIDVLLTYLKAMEED